MPSTTRFRFLAGGPSTELLKRALRADCLFVIQYKKCLPSRTNWGKRWDVSWRDASKTVTCTGTLPAAETRHNPSPRLNRITPSLLQAVKGALPDGASHRV